MIISQYKETFDVLLYYPKKKGGNIKDFLIKAIQNQLYTNIDLQSRKLISVFPGDGVKCNEKIQSYCANMHFYVKSRYERIF